MTRTPPPPPTPTPILSRKKSRHKLESNPGFSALESDALTTWPTRRSVRGGRGCTKGVTTRPPGGSAGKGRVWTPPPCREAVGAILSRIPATRANRPSFHLYGRELSPCLLSRCSSWRPALTAAATTNLSFSLLHHPSFFPPPSPPPSLPSCPPPTDSLAVKGATPGHRKRTSAGQAYLSSLRQERVGRAGVLVCLVVPSNQRQSDPPPGRRK